MSAAVATAATSAADIISRMKERTARYRARSEEKTPSEEREAGEDSRRPRPVVIIFPPRESMIPRLFTNKREYRGLSHGHRGRLPRFKDKRRRLPARTLPQPQI